MLPFDTSPNADRVQLDILRRMSAEERLRIAIDLSEFARKLAFTRIERDRPGLTRTQLIREFLRCVLTAEDYRRLPA
jgi:hypothetical protein